MSNHPPQPPQKSPGQPLPGGGLLGWLGRQVGHIRNALKADVTNTSKTIYRDTKVEEKPLPQDPNVKLRRTVIDEVVLNSKNPPPKGS